MKKALKTIMILLAALSASSLSYAQDFNSGLHSTTIPTQALWPKTLRVLMTPSQSAEVTFAPISLERAQWGELCDNQPSGGKKLFSPNSVHVTVGAEPYYVVETLCQTYASDQSSTFYIKVQHAHFDFTITFAFNKNAKGVENLMIEAPGNAHPMVLESTY